MIHPSTELKFVDEKIGFGIFATEKILKGTIVYIKDSLEIEITPARFRKLDDQMKEVVEKYSYMDERGVRILSWDHAKYVNHKCDCNTMSTGYGFEIAVKDIEKGEEISDEYGLFNIPYEVDLSCNCKNCRKKLLPSDLEVYWESWDEKVKEALKNIDKVQQKLWSIIDEKTKNDLVGYLKGSRKYRSVLNLKLKTKNRSKVCEF